MPAFCSITSGPLRPSRAWRVTISRLHRPAAIDMPPKQPTMPAITPTTGTWRRSATIAALISATAARPRFASCSRTPPVSSTSTGRIGRPAAASRRASSRAPAILAPETSPVLPPWNAPSMASTTAGTAVDGATADDHAVVALRHHALRHEPGRLDPIERVQQLAEGAGIEDGLRPARGRGARRSSRARGAGCGQGCDHGSAHDRLTSRAWARRRDTTPGVAPKSLISTEAATSWRAKKRSSTAFQMAP